MSTSASALSTPTKSHPATTNTGNHAVLSPTYDTINDPRGWMTLKIPSIHNYTYLRGTTVGVPLFGAKSNNSTTTTVESTLISSSSRSVHSRKRSRSTDDTLLSSSSSSNYPYTLSDNELIQYIEYLFLTSNNTLRHQLFISLFTVFDNPIRTLCTILRHSEAKLSSSTVPTPTKTDTSHNSVNSSSIFTFLSPYLTTTEETFDSSTSTVFHILYRLMLIQRYGPNLSLPSSFSSSVSIPTTTITSISLSTVPLLVSLLELSLTIHSLEFLLNDVGQRTSSSSLTIPSSSFEPLVFILQSYLSLSSFLSPAKVQQLKESSSVVDQPEGEFFSSLRHSSSSDTSSLYDTYSRQYNLHHQRLCTSLFMLCTVLEWIEYFRKDDISTNPVVPQPLPIEPDDKESLPYLYYDIFREEPNLYILFTECQRIMNNILLPIYTEKINLGSASTVHPLSSASVVVSPRPTSRGGITGSHSTSSTTGETPFPMFSVGDTFDSLDRVPVTLSSNESKNSPSLLSENNLNRNEQVSVVKKSKIVSVVSSTINPTKPVETETDNPIIPYHLPVLSASALASLETWISSLAASDPNVPEDNNTERVLPYLSSVLQYLRYRRSDPAVQVNNSTSTSIDSVSLMYQRSLLLLLNPSLSVTPSSPTVKSSNKVSTTNVYPSRINDAEAVSTAVEKEIPESIALIHHWSKHLLQQLLDRLIVILYTRKVLHSSDAPSTVSDTNVPSVSVSDHRLTTIKTLKEWSEELQKLLYLNEKSIYSMYVHDVRKYLSSWHEFMVHLYGDENEK